MGETCHFAMCDKNLEIRLQRQQSATSGRNHNMSDSYTYYCDLLHPIPTKLLAIYSIDSIKLNNHEHLPSLPDRPKCRHEDRLFVKSPIQFYVAEIPSNPPQKLSRAYLLLHDFEFTKYNEPTYLLVTSTALPTPLRKPTLPSLTEFTTNDFTSSSPTEINSFIRTNPSKLGFQGPGPYGKPFISAKIWIIIDQLGLDTDTCILSYWPTQA